jgi:multidrug efflux pump subunit AcrA (membrane-fusion protein)
VGDAALSLYDPQGMHLDLEVSEADIEKVEIGQSATITIDAIPDAVITGTVTSVSPVATSGQDVVNYKVQVTFNPADLPVKVGMSANAAITVETRQNVMQVPNRAITTQGPLKTIQVLYTADGKETPITVRITTGLTDGAMTEITGCVDTNNQCLRAGDRVAMTLQTTTGSQQGFPRDGVVQFGVGPGPGTGPGTNARPFVIEMGP